LGKFSGQLGWSQVGEYKREMDKGNAEIEPVYARFASMKPEEIAADAQAMAIGERLFMNNCAQCHGSDARGSKSFPNLTDGDWLYGGTPEKIRETLHQGRMGMMPPMGDAVGSAENVRNLAHYVLSLSNSPHDSLRAFGQGTFCGLRCLPRPGRQGQSGAGCPQPDRRHLAAWLG
jgi:cytochrome c oxidase cbb3-type subunit 3